MRGALSGAKVAGSIIRPSSGRRARSSSIGSTCRSPQARRPAITNCAWDGSRRKRNQRLTVVAPDGGFGGTVARLSPIPIDQITTDGSQLNIGTRLDWDVRPGLKLLGYTQATTEAQTGAPIDVTLYWQTGALA